MSLSDLDKLTLARALLKAYRWKLLDKPGPILPAEGKYYLGVLPHDRSGIGSIGHRPERKEQVESAIPSVPNSLGLAFLLAPASSGPMVIEVSGRFDLEHAYIPNYDDQVNKLQRDEEDPESKLRPRQDVVEAYRRYTVNFAAARFEIAVDTHSVRQLEPVTNTLQAALLEHLDTVAADPRVYRKLLADRRSQRAKRGIEWAEQITDQLALNQVVRTTLFEPQSGPLPYALNLTCQVRPAPVLMRTETAPREFFVEVFLVNDTTRQIAREYCLREHRIMDVNLRVRIVSGEHRRMRYQIAPEDYRYEAAQEIDGYGVTCALICNAQGDLISEALPVHEQPLFETPGPADIGMSESVEFARVAHDPLPVLEDFLRAMERYAGEWADEVASLERRGSKHATAAREDLEEFEDERRRVAQGVGLLRENTRIRRAFCLMSEAMGEALSGGTHARPAWRLFQLGFALTQVAEISARHQPRKEDLFADVLWFPAGEGKTEAILAVITFAMFYQRLMGREYGVTAWMRFPLRLLSLQQFRRLAFVIAAANRIRVREQIRGFPFTLGYFGGTLGRISSRKSYAAAHYLPELIKRPSWQSQIQLLQYCPHCSSPVKLEPACETFRIKHVCTNTECWSNQKHPNTGPFELHDELGIVVSAEECYREVPTLLVGTVDKIVVLGHNPSFRNFFGAATHYCFNHGFIVGGKCRQRILTPAPGGEWNDPAPCPNNSRTSAVRTVPLAQQMDPGISILDTDELHLEKEDLGNFAADYESAFEAIQCTYPGGRPPQVLASTATIRDFKKHVQHLFLRRGRRFPAPGRELHTTFYSRPKRDPCSGAVLSRRLYVGALPNTTRPNMIAEWVSDANCLYHELLTECVHTLETEPERAAPALGLPASLAAELLQHIRSMLNLTLVYVTRKRDATHVEKRFCDDNTRAAESGRPQRRYVRLDAETPLSEMQQAITTIETAGAPEPIEQIVSTSVASHGLHLKELNMELFTGWPPTTAEYLQASSRSGRVHAGLVLMALNPRNRFEASVFRRFRDYHRFIERLVEAPSINRFAPNVRQRTLPGIFHAVVLNWARQQPWGQKIGSAAYTLSHALNQPAAAEALTAMVIEALGYRRALALGVFNPQEVEEARAQGQHEASALVALFRSVQSKYASEGIGPAIRGMYRHGPMQSLRDIEHQVAILPATLLDEEVFAGLTGMAR